MRDLIPVTPQGLCTSYEVLASRKKPNIYPGKSYLRLSFGDMKIGVRLCKKRDAIDFAGRGPTRTRQPSLRAYRGFLVLSPASSSICCVATVALQYLGFARRLRGPRGGVEAATANLACGKDRLYSNHHEVPCINNNYYFSASIRLLKRFT